MTECINTFMFYLYLKTHNITNLKYLGYTKNDPFKYKGSGVHWSRHLSEYGNSVTTEILLATDDFDELSSTGLFFSKLYDIVNSKNFANLCEEDGNKNFGRANPNFMGHPQSLVTRKKISENSAKYWKGKTGKDHPAYGRSRPDSKEIVKLAHAARRGVPSWNSGKTGLQKHTAETKHKMSIAKLGIPKPKIECPHCGKIGGYPQMKQWHFDNCKEQNNSHRDS